MACYMSLVHLEYNSFCLQSNKDNIIFSFYIYNLIENVAS